MYILLAFGVAGIKLFYKHIQKILPTSIKSLVFRENIFFFTKLETWTREAIVLSKH